MANSADNIAVFWKRVVNCFQISNFVLWQTAFFEQLRKRRLL